MVYPYNNSNSIASISSSATGNTFLSCITRLLQYKRNNGIRGRTQSNRKTNGWIFPTLLLLLLRVVVLYVWQLGELPLTVDVDSLKNTNAASGDEKDVNNDVSAMSSQEVHSSRTANVTRFQHGSTAIRDDASLTFGIKPTYQSPTILQDGCLVTVLLMDPDIGLSAIWTLESVAEFVQPTERVCIFLQTSVCNVVLTNGGYQQQQGISKMEAAYQIKADRILQEAPPYLSRMIRQGQVRMTVLDHKKYHLNSCQYFYNPSFAWENIQYWGDAEFLPDIDADLVLTVQDDAVLCQILDVQRWQDNIAWIGAPWIPRQGSTAWQYCTAMPTNWKKFHNDLGYNATTNFPTPEEMCSNVAYGPQGNGGLSLRRRSWLRDAIRYCPTSILENSGLSKEEFEQARCRATQIAAEDSYFVTILRGLGAPLPSALDAALFSWESQTVPQILAAYHPPTPDCSTKQAKCSSNRTPSARWDPRTIEEWIASRWTISTDDAAQLAAAMITGSEIDPKSSFVHVPVGIHKPWGEFFKTRWMCHPDVHRQCKYLRKTLQYNKFGQRALNKQNKTLSQCVGSTVE